MSLSDCIKCWDTPCTCGWDYADLTYTSRIEKAAVILGVAADALADLITGYVPLEHPMKIQKKIEEDAYRKREQEYLKELDK